LRFSSSDALSLWKMSIANGLKRSWLEWSQTIGSVLCWEFAKDITLSPSLSQGVRGNFNYQALVTYGIPPGLVAFLNGLTGTNASYIQAQFIFDAVAGNAFRSYTVSIPDGVLMVDNQLVTISVGGITEEMLADKQTPTAPPGFRRVTRDFYGGAWYNTLWNGIKSAFKHIAPVAKGIAHIVGTVAPYLPIPGAAGVGAVSNAIATGLGAMGAGGRRMRSKTPRRRMGGKRMTAHSLSRRL
jgi:hypothetical protein